MKKLFFIPLLSFLTLFFTLNVNAACTNLFDMETFYSKNLDSSATVTTTSDSISISDSTYTSMPRFNIKGLEASKTYKLSFDIEYSPDDYRYSLVNTPSHLTVGYEFNSTSNKLENFSNYSSFMSNNHENKYEIEFTTTSTLTSTSQFTFTIYSQTTLPISFKNFKLYDASETCEDIPEIPGDDETGEGEGDSTGETVSLNDTYLLLIAAILMLIFMYNFIKSIFKRRI